MRTSRLLTAALAALVLLVAFRAASAQVRGTPPLDHYKTYFLELKPSLGLPIGLNDQFGPSRVVVLDLDQLANPVSKNGEPIFDPRTHLLWWHIQDAPQPVRHVVVTNQFGGQPWTLGDARWLLTPALKNETDPAAPLPTAVNHFKCYDAFGNLPPQTVVLVDQFGERQATVIQPVCLCNPAEKVLDSGQVFPIVNPEAHLACYRILPAAFYGLPVFIRDQFVAMQNLVTEDCLLCVPSLKEVVTPAVNDTWGRIKSQYR